MPKFTKQHYGAIAKVLKNQYPCDAADNGILYFAMDALVESFVEVFMHDNPNFQPDKFRKAVEKG